MEIIKTSDFETSFEKLPGAIQNLYKIQERRFTANWHDPRLHIKQIRALPLALSFRVTRNYRVLFYFQNRGRAIFFYIAHRKDVYK